MPTMLRGAYKLLQILMVICMSAMAIMIFVNVVLRYAFNSGLEISEELSRYFFVWMTFLGAIAAFIKGTHIRVDMFFRRMSPPVQRVVSIFNDMIMIFCCVLIFIGCWNLANANWNNLLPISEVPVGVLYFAGVPSSLVIGILLVVHVWKTLTSSGKERAQ